MESLYPLLHDLHVYLSRVGLIIGVGMFGIAIFIGLIRHGDVNKWFLAATYTTIILMGLQALVGLAIYSTGARPFEEVHLIYGVGVVCSLPFFVYVERTAKKRPAMGS